MKPGRKRLPPSATKARGTYRPDRHDGIAEMTTPRDLPQAPDWLTDAGRLAWLDLVGRVSTTRLATELDSGLFAVMCNLQGAIGECWRSGEVPPAAHLAELRRLSEMFGLAGAGSRLTAPPIAKPEENPFLRFRKTSP